MKKNKVSIPINGFHLNGTLTIPENAPAVVIFSHGSGSSHLSPRNIYLANILQQAGLATLLFDLLSEDEDSTMEARFNIHLLTERLLHVIEWLTSNKDYGHLVPMLFGSSTGAASALKAAVELDDMIRAVVLRGGRPDLAGDKLKMVTAPTLFIVGELDFEILKMNRSAMNTMLCKKKLAVIPGASHLFEEQGKLDDVAKLAVDWFLMHKPKKVYNQKNKVLK
jgi:putative phosphoribosyl transferase